MRQASLRIVNADGVAIEACFEIQYCWVGKLARQLHLPIGNPATFMVSDLVVFSRYRKRPFGRPREVCMRNTRTNATSCQSGVDGIAFKKPTKDDCESQGFPSNRPLGALLLHLSGTRFCLKRRNDLSSDQRPRLPRHKTCSILISG